MRYLVTWFHWLYFLHEQTPEPIRNKIVNFCPFHPFWSIFAAFEQRCLLVHHGFPRNLCASFGVLTRCQVDKSFTKTSSMPCWDLIIHILPLGAAESDEVFTYQGWKQWRFEIGNEEIHGKQCEKCAIDCIQHLELGSRSLPFWDRTLWWIDKDDQMLKIVWHLFWGSIIFDLSLGNWTSTYRCFHLHLPQPRWSF